MVEKMAGVGMGFGMMGGDLWCGVVGGRSSGLRSPPVLSSPPPAARPTVDSTKTHHIKENCYDQR